MTIIGDFFSCCTFSPFFSPFSPLDHSYVWQQKEKNWKLKKSLKRHFFSMSPTFTAGLPLLRLSWPNLLEHDSGWCRLENNPLKTSTFMVSLTFVLDIKMKWSKDKFNDQITYLRDDFMVHDVSKPLTLTCWRGGCLLNEDIDIGSKLHANRQAGHLPCIKERLNSYLVIRSYDCQ
jgi:hypothetical protein